MRRSPACATSLQEVIKAAGLPYQSGLRDLFMLVWNYKDIPGNRRTGIILPLYNGNGSKMGCSNFRGITHLFVTGMVFAHILLSRINPLIHAKRHYEQSGFTPGSWTVDRILTLGILAQTSREYHQPLYSAYVDLKAACDSVDRGVPCKLMRVLGLPPKILSIIEHCTSTP